MWYLLVEPTDIITQLIHLLNGWIHMEATLRIMLSLLRGTDVFHNDSTIIVNMSNSR